MILNDNHDEGFEKEALFRKISILARNECPSLKNKTIKMIIFHVAPDFLNDLNEIRKCSRKLKYIGFIPNVCNSENCKNCEEKVCQEKGFFEEGKIYQSIDFNGGTYSIEGYEGRIGTAYFEWIKL